MRMIAASSTAAVRRDRSFEVSNGLICGSSGSGDVAVEPVAHAKIPTYERNEPRIATVERMSGEIRPVESGFAIAGIGDLAGVHDPQIGHHGNTGAIAAQRKVKTVQLAHVRQLVECEGDIAGPGMGDATALELRKAVAHELIKKGSGLFGRILAKFGSAAEDQPP